MDKLRKVRKDHIGDFLLVERLAAVTLCALWDRGEADRPLAKWLDGYIDRMSDQRHRIEKAEGPYYLATPAEMETIIKTAVLAEKLRGMQA